MNLKGAAIRQVGVAIRLVNLSERCGYKASRCGHNVDESNTEVWLQGRCTLEPQGIFHLSPSG